MEVYSSETSDSDDDTSLKTLDFSYKSLDTPKLCDDIKRLFIATEMKPQEVYRLNVYQNNLTEVPKNISVFSNLRKINMSNNRISAIPDVLTRLPLLTLILKNNNLDDCSFPKSLETLISTLEVLNLSGNYLTIFPEQILSLIKLKYLYLGENQIENIPYHIHNLNRLEILSLGGNALNDVPNSVCQLHELRALILSGNKLECLPACIANLRKLQILQVHRNKLRTLPTEIVMLKHLTELNLRENPLINKFVNEMIYDPPTLRELSARVIKLFNIHYTSEDMPKDLHDYLLTAHHCVNPKCKGVYFNSRVEHIKFVDVCGKYRVPLLQYLCSPKCINHISGENSDNVEPSNSNLMSKVLLG